jgi:hypothetical protein
VLVFVLFILTETHQSLAYLTEPPTIVRLKEISKNRSWDNAPVVYKLNETPDTYTVFEIRSNTTFHISELACGDSTIHFPNEGSIITLSKYRNTNTYFAIYKEITSKGHPTLLCESQYLLTKENAHWQLPCLSGDPIAIDYAVDKLGLINETRDNVGRSPFHFAVFSGNIAQVDRLIERGFTFNEEENFLNSKAMSLLWDYATSSGISDEIRARFKNVEPYYGVSSSDYTDIPVYYGL